MVVWSDVDIKGELADLKLVQRFADSVLAHHSANSMSAKLLKRCLATHA